MEVARFPQFKEKGCLGHMVEMDGVSKPFIQHLTTLKRWVAICKRAEIEGLNELDASGKDLTDADAKAIGDMLALPNIQLTKLNLSCNKIGKKGAIGLGKGVEKNATLTTLSLDNNQIGDEGAIGLGKAVEKNATLTTLDLGFNKIGDDGAIGLGKAVEKNATLTILSLDN